MWCAKYVGRSSPCNHLYCHSEWNMSTINTDRTEPSLLLTSARSAFISIRNWCVTTTENWKMETALLRNVFIYCFYFSVCSSFNLLLLLINDSLTLNYWLLTSEKHMAWTRDDRLIDPYRCDVWCMWEWIKLRQTKCIQQCHKWVNPIYIIASMICLFWSVKWLDVTGFLDVSSPPKGSVIIADLSSLV